MYLGCLIPVKVAVTQYYKLHDPNKPTCFDDVYPSYTTGNWCIELVQQNDNDKIATQGRTSRRALIRQ